MRTNRSLDPVCTRLTHLRNEIKHYESKSAANNKLLLELEQELKWLEKGMFKAGNLCSK